MLHLMRPKHLGPNATRTQQVHIHAQMKAPATEDQPS